MWGLLPHVAQVHPEIADEEGEIVKQEDGAVDLDRLKQLLKVMNATEGDVCTMCKKTFKHKREGQVRNN